METEKPNKPQEDNLFRKEYRILNDSEKSKLDAIKDAAWALRCLMLETDGEIKSPVSRQMSLAITNLEQCVMWAVKSITG